MIRNLLASTAVLALLTTGAIAAENESKMPTDTTQTTPAAPTGEATGATPSTPDTAAPAEEIVPPTGDTAAMPDQSTGETFISAQADHIMGSTLIGSTVYSGVGEDAEVIGDINDIVLSQSGQAEGVVIGVGGFLGMGEKDVAVNFDRLQWTQLEGDDVRITMSSTKEELESAPEFDRSGMAGEDAPTME